VGRRLVTRAGPGLVRIRAAAIGDWLRHGWPLPASMQPLVQRVFPLARAADASRLLEANEARGTLAPPVA
jgi:hypothetical protein